MEKRYRGAQRSNNGDSDCGNVAAKRSATKHLGGATPIMTAVWQESSEWERNGATTVTDGDGVCHQHST